MVNYTLYFTKQANKDAEHLKQAGLKQKAEQLLEIISDNPYTNPPKYEKLIGGLTNCYSRRINIKHRLVYQVIEANKAVKILRMWIHYGDN